MRDFTPTSLYRYYDDCDVLIYVGITKRGTTRNSEHNASKAWWPYVARQAVEHFPTRPEAQAREVELIERHTPPFNTQHNPRHAEMRAAYLTVVAAARPDADPVELLREVDGRLPLRLTGDSDDGGRTLTFRTEAAHITLASRLQLSPKARIITPPNGVGLGQVTGIEMCGPFAVVRAVARRSVEVGEVYAVVKRLAVAKGPIGFALRKIVLVD